MIVNPGIRRFLGSAIQRLFNSASFSAPLTHSLVPERGTGSPTFTRASTATFRDWEGVLRTVPSGCARFEGARMVQNLWTTSSATLANLANKSLTLAAGTYTFSMGAGTGTATFSGTGGATGTLAASAAGRVEVTKTITAGTFVVTASVADLVDLQVEYVTGQADQTASEYVSVGVPSDWAGDELVTNGAFDTDTTGWSSGRDLVSWSSGMAKATSVAADGAFFGTAISVVSGVKYVISTEAMSDGVSVAARTYLGTGIGTSDIAVGPSGYIFGRTTFEYTSGVTGTIYLWFYGLSATPGNYILVDNISVKPAYYHGSFVDGVKCFPTDINGVPLTTMLGYSAEGARTNLILSADDLTNGVYWSASGSGVAAPTVTVGQIDQAGTTKALKLDFPSVSVATNFSLFFTASPVAVTASPHSNSWRLKGAVGGEQIYISGTPDGVTYLSQLVTVTNEWADYELVGTPTAANWYWQIGVDLRDGGQSAKSAQTVYVCFPQLELGSFAGSFAGSYIATTTAAVTRAADVDSVPTASNILAAASTVCLEFTPDHTPSGTIALWGTYVDASNYTAILHDATNMIMRKRIAGVNYDATIANAFTANTTYKVCGSWGASGVTVTLNGTEGTPHANTTAAQIAATMQWGADGNSLQQPFATERNARVWQRQLSTSERGAITA